MHTEEDEHGLQGNKIALPITSVEAHFKAIGLAEGYALGVNGLGNFLVVIVVVGIEHRRTQGMLSIAPIS